MIRYCQVNARLRYRYVSYCSLPRIKMQKQPSTCDRWICTEEDPRRSGVSRKHKITLSDIVEVRIQLRSAKMLCPKLYTVAVAA